MALAGGRGGSGTWVAILFTKARNHIKNAQAQLSQPRQFQILFPQSLYENIMNLASSGSAHRSQFGPIILLQTASSDSPTR